MEISDNAYTIIYIGTTIINLVVFICFILLIRDVNQIKKLLIVNTKDSTYYMQQYYKYNNLDNMDKAAEALYTSFELSKKETSGPKAIAMYSSFFDELNLPMPN